VSFKEARKSIAMPVHRVYSKQARRTRLIKLASHLCSPGQVGCLFCIKSVRPASFVVVNAQALTARRYMKLTGHSRYRRLWCSYNMERSSFCRRISTKEETGCSRRLGIDRGGSKWNRAGYSGGNVWRRDPVARGCGSRNVWGNMSVADLHKAKC
jgi:hypothetical protein